MEIEFADPDYDRLEIDASFSAGFAPAVVKAYRKRLQYIRAALDERDLYASKGAHFERLQGDRAGTCSMRLNDQWRLILKLERRANGKIVVIISIADYH
jgi:proteic killer suppression protein